MIGLYSKLKRKLLLWRKRNEKRHGIHTERKFMSGRTKKILNIWIFIYFTYKELAIKRRQYKFWKKLWLHISIYYICVNGIYIGNLENWSGLVTGTVCKKKLVDQNYLFVLISYLLIGFLKSTLFANFYRLNKNLSFVK